MNLYLTDHSIQAPFGEGADSILLNLNEQTISPCTGCFSCWIRTPGRCVIRDDAAKIAPLLARCDRLMLITRVQYGCYDLPMKRLLERCLPMQQPFLRVHEGEIHHVLRDVHPKVAVLIAYDCNSKAQQELFTRLAERNAKNLNWTAYKVLFVDEEQLEDTVKKEASAWEE